jgi:hypothetical protein
MGILEVSKTEHHRCLCLQTISYPKKKEDTLSLQTLQTNFAQEIGVLTETVKISFSKIERSLLLLPRVDGSGSGQSISTVAVQSDLEQRISHLEGLSNRTEVLWKNIKSFTEIAELITVQRKFVQTIRYVERFSRDILEEPLLLIEKQFLTEVGPESIITLGLSGTDSSRLILTLETKVNGNQIQGPPGVEGKVLPVTTAMPTSVTDPTTTVPSVTMSEPTTVSSTTTSPMTTTLISTTTTTVTTTTTSTPRRVTPPSVADDSEIGWWEWITKKAEFLKTFSQWLGVSVWFLTIYDIVIGVLCMLNSAYILYKLCERNLDNRRPGETRFRTALVRLFGRKRENPQVKDIEVGQPMHDMPTAPQPPTNPMVKCMSRQVPVRQRTPTRRINIEEYGKSSSSEEEYVPLQGAMKAYKKVRLDEIPQVKTIKRRAPTSPLVSTVYLREDMPYYLDVE